MEAATCSSPRNRRPWIARRFRFSLALVYNGESGTDEGFRPGYTFVKLAYSDSGDSDMVVWQHGWRAFDLPEKEEYFLRELAWEIETNSRHPLFGRQLRIAGWIPGYDDFILSLPDEHRHVYVHLTWRQEDSPDCPYCEFLETVEEVNSFVSQWEDG